MGSPRSPYRSPSAPPGAQRPRQAQQHAREQRTCPPPESRAARTDRPARARARVARTPVRRHGSANPGPPRRSAHREPTRAALPRTAAPAQGHQPETRSDRSASPIQPMPPWADSPLPSDGDHGRRDPHLPLRLHRVPPRPATSRRIVARRPLRPRRLPNRSGEEPLLPTARADARRRDGRRLAADRADEGPDRPARAPGRRRRAARLEPRRERGARRLRPPARRKPQAAVRRAGTLQQRALPRAARPDEDRALRGRRGALRLRVGPQLPPRLSEARRARPRARRRARTRAHRDRDCRGRRRYPSGLRDRGARLRRHRFLPTEPNAAHHPGPRT
jgi:hypothetical protein